MRIECRWRDTALDLIPCEREIVADDANEIINLYKRHLVEHHGYHGWFQVMLPPDTKNLT